MYDIRQVISYSDVYLVPRFSDVGTSKHANLYTQYNVPRAFPSIPLINAPMYAFGVQMLNYIINNGMTITIHRLFNTPKEQLAMVNMIDKKSDWGKVFVAVGSITRWKPWIDYLLKANSDRKYPFSFLVDVANGDTAACIDTVTYLRQYGRTDVNIMAGNVATGSGYEHLMQAGANFIRVGIGGGSICSTRLQTGFGVPVLTSVIDCARKKHPKAYIIADGGIEYAGDICKAIAAGADMVMCGKLLAGTSLSAGAKYRADGEITGFLDDAKYVNYYGLASKTALSKLRKTSVGSIEGVDGLIPYTGDTAEVLEGILANLRQAMTYYGGCTNWDDFQRHAKFVQISPTGLTEGLTRVMV